MKSDFLHIASITPPDLKLINKPLQVDVISFRSSGPRSSCCCIATTTCNLSRGSRNCQWSWVDLWDELLLEHLTNVARFGVKKLPPPFPKMAGICCLAFVSLMTVGSARTQIFLGIAPKSPPRRLGTSVHLSYEQWISPNFFVEGYHFETTGQHL